jgi:hypothetical protein
MMSLQLQLSQPCSADFENATTLETLSAELLYLRNRMRYYHETVTLAQVQGLLDNIETLNEDGVTDEECERREDRARTGDI